MKNCPLPPPHFKGNMFYSNIYFWRSLTVTKYLSGGGSAVKNISLGVLEMKKSENCCNTPHIHTSPMHCKQKSSFPIVLVHAFIWAKVNPV